MYLLIFEHGSLLATNTLTSTEFKEADDGLLDIIRPHLNGRKLYYEQYAEGNWHRIEEYNPED